MNGRWEVWMEEKFVEKRKKGCVGVKMNLWMEEKMFECKESFVYGKKERFVGGLKDGGMNGRM